MMNDFKSKLDDLLDDMARVVAEYLRENKIKIEN